MKSIFLLLDALKPDSELVVHIRFELLFLLNRLNSSYYCYLEDNFLPLSKPICTHRVKGSICAAIR